MSKYHPSIDPEYCGTCQSIPCQGNHDEPEAPFYESLRRMEESYRDEEESIEETEELVGELVDEDGNPVQDEPRTRGKREITPRYDRPGPRPPRR